MAKHFVLVHGACLGAWCWYKLVAMLKSMGHKVSALDLAASGRNMMPVQQVRGISDYSQPLIEFMEALPAEERVVLVGHSMGGLPTTLVMEKFPHKIAAAVFVAAFMPGPNLPFLDIVEQVKRRNLDFLDSVYTYENGSENPPTSVIFGPKCAAAIMYQCSPPQDLSLATLLMRPAPLFNHPDALNGLSPREENYGSVRRVYIICTEDPGMGELQDWMIEKNPPDDVQELATDHMAMCSRASELCSHLIEVAKKYG